ncbi:MULTISPECIES: hypothetical protein [unclassified Streptomyces]|uniref:hypothetical protein n=1 Tax=unclassified Streptomyces TaxID=2593676 RepID=UPI00332AB734
MPNFQTGEIPHGFAFNEDGGLIHYKHTVTLAVPAANQANTWGDAWLSFGSDWADVRLRVAVHDGKIWALVKNWDIKAASGRLAEKLPAGAQKISIGRVKTSGTDSVDDAPVSWLLEYL